MKTYRLLWLLAIGWLLPHMGTAQETAQSVKDFQGLWKARTGHSLHVDYGFFVNQSYVKHSNVYQTVRFDVAYQYDIPWRHKRSNFFVETGLTYRWYHCDIEEYEGDVRLARKKRKETEHRAIWHTDLGIKVYCTDWLYLSFSGGLNIGYADSDYFFEAYQRFASPAWELTTNSHSVSKALVFAGHSAVRLVGQIKQFSISLGYQADHWFAKITENGRFYTGDYMSLFDESTDWFVTLGVGYHF